MEILSQAPFLELIVQFIIDGFFLGALVGAIFGASVWTIMDRGLFDITPLLVTAGLGIIAGIYFEGDAIVTLYREGAKSFLSGSGFFQSAVFVSAATVLGWGIAAMVVGAIIADYKLAIKGFVVGGLMGTVSGTLVQAMGHEFNFPLDSPLTTITVILLAVLFVILIVVSREKHRR